MGKKEITDKFEKYIKIFEIKNPPELKIGNKDDSGVVTYIDQKLTIVADEELGEGQIIELLATVKLGEINPLLAVPIFHKDMEPELRDMWALFNTITQPIISFWSTQIMQSYLPPEEYDAELKVIKREVIAAAEATVNGDKLDKLSLSQRTALISGILSLKADKNNSEIDYFPDSFKEGNELINSTYQFAAHKKPDPDVLIEYTSGIFDDVVFSIKDGVYMAHKISNSN